MSIAENKKLLAKFEQMINTADEIEIVKDLGNPDILGIMKQIGAI